MRRSGRADTGAPIGYAGGMQRLLAMMATMTAAAWALTLGGCAAGSAQCAVPAGAYSATFEAARNVLRDERWLIERVDASAGVLTTQRRADLVVDDAAGTLENLANRQLRHVRITFEPAEGGAAPIPPADAQDPERTSLSPDLTAGDVPLVMKVSVLIERVQRPGRRVQSDSIRLTSYSSDPALAERGLEPQFAAAAGNDAVMAGNLARRIAERAGLRSDAARP